MITSGKSVLQSISAYTTDTFKSRLDKFWQHQDILYDYKVELTGVRNRSQINGDDNIVHPSIHPSIHPSMCISRKCSANTHGWMDGWMDGQCYHPHLSDFCSRPRLTQPYNHIIYPGVAKIYLVYF